MAAILILASRTSVMGCYAASKPVLALGWLATALMAVAAMLMFIA